MTERNNDKNSGLISPEIGLGASKNEWSSSLVKEGQAWHTPTIDSIKKTLPQSQSFDDLQIKAKPDGLPHVVSDTNIAAHSKQNVFRTSENVTNRAFATRSSATALAHAALEGLDLSTPAGSPRSGRAGSATGLPEFSTERLQRCASMSETKASRRMKVADRAVKTVAAKGTSTFAEYVISRNGKVVIAMVGLPARGKSFIAMGIKRHLDWLGLETRIFNAGNYRREMAAAAKLDTQDSAFFDPTNQSGAEVRRRCAEAALKDAIESLESSSCCVAIFDATNTTKSRRKWLKEEVAAAGAAWAEKAAEDTESSTEDGASVSPPLCDTPLKLAFAETVLTDDEQVWENVREAKLKSPDYAGMDPQAAMEDFMARIAVYKKVYEPLDRAEGVSFIRLTNAGEELLSHKCSGYTLGRISWLMGSMRLTPRPILLTRSGESEHDTQGRMGGDPPLTGIGALYAKKLQASMLEWQDKNKHVQHGGAVVWTSTRLRALQTVAGLGKKFPILRVPMLDELKFGAADSLTHAEFAESFPDVAGAREKDKLNVRFPGGESYLDLFKRLEPLLLELIAETQPVVIISHLGVLRVIYGYLMGIAPKETPYLDIPMNAVVQLNPKGYGYEEWRHLPT